jgi:hypothetical protein
MVKAEVVGDETEQDRMPALAWFVVSDRVKLAAYRVLGVGEPSIPGGRKQ